MISKVIRFINTDIWKTRLKNLSLPKAFFIKYLREGDIVFDFR